MSPSATEQRSTSLLSGVPRSRAIAIVLALALVVGTTRCGSGETEGPPGASPLPTLPERDTMKLGAFEGVVLRGSARGVDDVCVWLESDDGRVVSALWPYGHYLATDPIRVIDRDGNVVASVGDTLDLGGGLTADRPERCHVGKETFEIGTIEVVRRAADAPITPGP